MTLLSFNRPVVMVAMMLLLVLLPNSTLSSVSAEDVVVIVETTTRRGQPRREQKESYQGRPLRRQELRSTTTGTTRTTDRKLLRRSRSNFDEEKKEEYVDMSSSSSSSSSSAPNLPNNIDKTIMAAAVSYPYNAILGKPPSEQIKAKKHHAQNAIRLFQPSASYSSVGGDDGGNSNNDDGVIHFLSPNAGQEEEKEESGVDDLSDGIYWITSSKSLLHQIPHGCVHRRRSISNDTSTYSSSSFESSFTSYDDGETEGGGGEDEDEDFEEEKLQHQCVIELGVPVPTMDVQVAKSSTILNTFAYGNSIPSQRAELWKENGYTYSFHGSPAISSSSIRTNKNRNNNEYNIEVDYDTIDGSSYWTKELLSKCTQLGYSPSLAKVINFFRDVGTHGIDTASFTRRRRRRSRHSDNNDGDGVSVFMEEGASYYGYREFHKEIQKSEELASQGMDPVYGFHYVVDKGQKNKDDDILKVPTMNPLEDDGTQDDGDEDDDVDIDQWTYRPIWTMNIPTLQATAKQMMELYFVQIVNAAAHCSVISCHGHGSCATKVSIWEEKEEDNASMSTTMIRNAGQLFDTNRCYCDDGWIGSTCNIGRPIAIQNPIRIENNDNDYGIIIGQKEDIPLCGIKVSTTTMTKTSSDIDNHQNDNDNNVIISSLQDKGRHEHISFDGHYICPIDDEITNFSKSISTQTIKRTTAMPTTRTTATTATTTQVKSSVPQLLLCDKDKVMTNLLVTKKENMDNDGDKNHDKNDGLRQKVPPSLSSSSSWNRSILSWTATCTHFQNTKIDDSSCEYYSYNPFKDDNELLIDNKFIDNSFDFQCPLGKVIVGIDPPTTTFSSSFSPSSSSFSDDEQKHINENANGRFENDDMTNEGEYIMGRNMSFQCCSLMADINIFQSLDKSDTWSDDYYYYDNNYDNYGNNNNNNDDIGFAIDATLHIDNDDEESNDYEKDQKSFFCGFTSTYSSSSTTTLDNDTTVVATTINDNGKQHEGWYEKKFQFKYCKPPAGQGIRATNPMDVVIIKNDVVGSTTTSTSSSSTGTTGSCPDGSAIGYLSYNNDDICSVTSTSKSMPVESSSSSSSSCWFYKCYMYTGWTTDNCYWTAPYYSSSTLPFSSSFELDVGDQHVIAGIRIKSNGSSSDSDRDSSHDDSYQFRICRLLKLG